MIFIAVQLVFQNVRAFDKIISLHRLFQGFLVVQQLYGPIFFLLLSVIPRTNSQIYLYIKLYSICECVT